MQSNRAKVLFTGGTPEPHGRGNDKGVKSYFKVSRFCLPQRRELQIMVKIY